MKKKFTFSTSPPYIYRPVERARFNATVANFYKHKIDLLPVCQIVYGATDYYTPMGTNNEKQIKASSEWRFRGNFDTRY